MDVRQRCLSAEKSSRTSYSMMADFRRTPVWSKCEAGIRRNVQDGPEDYPYIWHRTTSIILHGSQDLPRFRRQRGVNIILQKSMQGWNWVLAIFGIHNLLGCCLKVDRWSIFAANSKSKQCPHVCAHAHHTHTHLAIQSSMLQCWFQILR